MSEMESLLSELVSIESKNVAESGEICGADTSSVLPGPGEEKTKLMEDKESRLDESDEDEGGKKEVDTNNDDKLSMSREMCTLYEEASIKDNFNPDCSWRSDIQLDDLDEDSETDSEDEDEDEDDYDDSSDEESEEAAAEWLRQYYLRQRGVPPVLAQLPDTIKVSVVPESFAEKQAREEKEREEKKLRREEMLKKLASQPVGQISKKGKRKFGDRMELEEASRDDFGNGQDYVDFLNAKLKNVSIKVTK